MEVILWFLIGLTGSLFFSVVARIMAVNTKTKMSWCPSIVELIWIGCGTIWGPLTFVIGAGALIVCIIITLAENAPPIPKSWHDPICGKKK